MRPVALVATFAALALTAGCINRFWQTEPRALPHAATGGLRETVLTTPVKAHMADGSTVLFRAGATLTGKQITGFGDSYALLSNIATLRKSVPLDSVVGLETFEGKILAAPSIVVSVAATAAGILGSAVLLVAIFGSCPTVYADTGSGLSLQAEGFSYAIAPLLEHRDVDPLHARVDADGKVRLELRNEALETHFINHIELLSLRHASGTRVVPDQNGQPLVVADIRPVIHATDRAGRDVRATLASPDGKLFSSAHSVVDAAHAGDLDDWIDLDAADLPPGDSIAVVLRLRNSLLNTILLYDGVLGGRDAPNWLASGMQQISAAIDLSDWYVRTMGMRASVGGASPANGSVGDRTFARLGDVGPIAFRDVALVLPRPEHNARSARVRLRFVADNWRIDHVQIGGTFSRPTVTGIPIDQVIAPISQTTAQTAVDTAAAGAIRDADDRYLETRPGQRMTLVFAPRASRPSADSTTTYMIAWQGWYREWIRGKWLAEPTRTVPFVPGDSAVLTALHSWRERQADFERAFYKTRIPVR